MPVLQEMNGVREPWTFGYLIDVILTRVPWMHRLDIAEHRGPVLERRNSDGLRHPRHLGPLLAPVQERNRHNVTLMRLAGRAGPCSCAASS